jgi:hypothetical protein
MPAQNILIRKAECLDRTSQEAERIPGENNLRRKTQYLDRIS